MTKDNEDALDVAEAVQCFEGCECPKNEAAAHLRRLVRENEAKDALLRQAMGALEGVHAGEHQGGVVEAIDAIRQHLEGRHA